MATKKIEPEVKKRRRTELVEVPKRKREVAVEEPKRISKLNTKGMRSIIGDSAEDIQQMLERNNNDGAVSLIQKRLLQGVVDVLPYAEHAIRNTKGHRGVYQFNSLITSLRELMIDLQSTRDKGALGAALVEKIVRPAFLDIGMALVQEDARLDNEIKDLVDAKTYKLIKAAKKESLERLAATIQSKYGEAKSQSVSFLQS